MKRFFSPIAILLIGLSFISSLAQASLLIAPTRVAFGDRDRSQSVTLINSGNKVMTYRLEWITNRATEEGGYIELTEQESANFPTAADFIRVSPRQVTLQPGERQAIKLLVRRPRDLADGEYRSHLKFTALPNNRDAAGRDAQGIDIRLDLLLSYSIPVIVRKGSPEVNVDIEDLAIEMGPEKTNITLDLVRSGPYSVTGRLLAYWKERGTKDEKQVGILNGVNVFPEVNRRETRLVWQDFDKSFKRGTLRIIFEGEAEFRNQVLAERTVELNLGG